MRGPPVEIGCSATRTFLALHMVLIVLPTLAPTLSLRAQRSRAGQLQPLSEVPADHIHARLDGRREARDDIRLVGLLRRAVEPGRASESKSAAAFQHIAARAGRDGRPDLAAAARASAALSRRKMVILDLINSNAISRTAWRVAHRAWPTSMIWSRYRTHQHSVAGTGDDFTSALPRYPAPFRESDHR